MTPPATSHDSASDSSRLQRTIDWIGGYKAAQNSALDAVPAAAIAEVVELIRMAGAEGRRSFVCGNGGNAANAAHFTTDLGKGASAVARRAARDRHPKPLTGVRREESKPRERPTGPRSAQPLEKLQQSGSGAFRETRSGRPGRSSRGFRVAHQPEDRCGSAIDRAILYPFGDARPRVEHRLLDVRPDRPCGDIDGPRCRVFWCGRCKWLTGYIAKKVWKSSGEIHVGGRASRYGS